MTEYFDNSSTDPEDPFWAGLLAERPKVPEQRRPLESVEVAKTRTAETVAKATPVDLGWLLTGVAPPLDPAAEFLTRDDGAALFYAGKYNLVYGDPESGKTWVALAAIVEALAAGKRCAFVDMDHNGAASLAGKLVRLGAPAASVADPNLFRLYVPEGRDEILEVVTALVGWQMDGVAVFDSLGELLPLMGYNSNSNDEVGLCLEWTLMRVASAGAAVVAIDHQAKSKESGQGFSIGAIRKKSMVNGVSVHVEVIESLAPGRVGEVRLFVYKDRSGRVREVITGPVKDLFGTFVLDSTAEDSSSFAVRFEDGANLVAADGGFRPTKLMLQVSRFLEDSGEPLYKSVIAKAVPGRNEHVLRALQVLVAEGFVREVPQGARKVFEFISPFRDTPVEQAHVGWDVEF